MIDHNSDSSQPDWTGLRLPCLIILFRQKATFSRARPTLFSRGFNEKLFCCTNGIVLLWEQISLATFVSIISFHIIISAIKAQIREGEVQSKVRSLCRLIFSFMFTSYMLNCLTNSAFLHLFFFHLCK